MPTSGEPETSGTVSSAGSTGEGVTGSSGSTGEGATDEGETQPADLWLPRPGQIININQNSASEVDIDGGEPTPGKWYNGFYGANSFAGMAHAWNGAVWCSEYSPDGALAFFGGGHGANIGCFSYLFDVSSRTWKQVGAQRNLPPDGLWSGGYPYGSAPDLRDPDWLDYDYQGSKIVVLAHQYSATNYLTPAEGGAPGVGSLLVPNGERDQTAGMASRWGAWTFSLADGEMARSRSNPPTDGIGSGSLISVKDTVNGKLWYFTQGSQQAFYQDLTKPTPRPVETVNVEVEPGAPNGGYMVVYDVGWLFVPEAKAALAFLGSESVDGGMSVVLVDFASGGPVMAAVDIPSLPAGPGGFAHGGLNIGSAWDSKRQRVVLYEGLGEWSTHVLTPSSLDFRTCTWTWSREVYTGRPPANALGEVAAASSLQSAWGRWRYVPSLDVFLWTDGPETTGETEDGVMRDGIVQFWHPEGTPM